MTNQRSKCRGVCLRLPRWAATTSAPTTPRPPRPGAAPPRCRPSLPSSASPRWLRWPPWRMCTEVRGRLRSPMMDSQKKCHRLLSLFPVLTSEAPFPCKTLCFTYSLALSFPRDASESTWWKI
uniref:BBX high mobility group box domain containing n=1 Tax=Equus caballus TaxID=9796 RepID=A0A3Q2HBX6_HORSE